MMRLQGERETADCGMMAWMWGAANEAQDSRGSRGDCLTEHSVQQQVAWHQQDRAVSEEKRNIAVVEVC